MKHSLASVRVFCVVLLAILANTTRATETENINFRVLPKPGPVTVDGDDADWDLSGGVFACGDVENARDNFAVWLHGMYDEENVYLLARWTDRTPMNHPGSTKGDYGFNGDCLQIRFVTAPDVTAQNVARPGNNDNDAPQARTCHLSCWRDREGMDVIDIEYGRRFNEGKVKDAKTLGAQQAFKKWSDGRGYTQEIAIPWKVITKPDVKLSAGSQFLFTVEPNFTIGSAGRLTIKDIFKPGVSVDRIFTFSGSGCWGFATLEAKGALDPRPVRLSDAREFPVRIENRYPVIDWTGVIKSREPDGFKAIKFNMPEDGYVSLNVFRADGSVARQLLNSAFYTKGEHTVKWDGLTTMSVRKPGEVLESGEYTWAGIYHTGIGLRLRGWAGNSGDAPWGNVWGGDHGNPVAVAADNNQIYIGWGGGEGSKPLQAVDSNGSIKWKNIRGGIASAGPVAADGGTVYAFNSIGQYATSGIYRVDARTGNYTEWSALKSTDLTMKDLWGDASDAPKGPSAIAARDGRVFISFHGKNAVIVVDSKTGKALKTLTVTKPGDLEALSAQKFVVLSEGSVLSVDVESGEAKPVAKAELKEGDWTSALAVDKAGNLYVGIRGKNHVVQVFSPDGKLLRTIGKEGGRPLLGKWDPNGFYNISGLAIDSKNQLWATEDDGNPRRVSVFDAETGAFKNEFFGATSYGATGGAINPVDPLLMVGMGCEWRIDPKTGKSSSLGVITRDGMNACRFGFGDKDKLFLAVTNGFLHGIHPIGLYERLGDANYKLRTSLSYDEKTKTVRVWADENDDSAEQPNEVTTHNIDLGGWFQGWYLSMAPDLTFYGTLYQVKVDGWTACGAPKYDLSKAVKLPAPANVKGRGGMGAQRGHGSADGKYMLWNAGYGEDHGTVDCYDIATGKLAWTYPSNFTGVHGSHRACSAEVGMMRGAYDITGTAQLPAPVGNIWVIPTNKGEWHALTEKGFYLTKFFEGDPMKNLWPEKAGPGAILDACPPGAGEEAFGGSISCSKDGKLSLQAGHTSFWNVEVVGTETVKALSGGSVSLSSEDTKTAAQFRERYLQDSSGAKQIVIKKATPAFTGELQKDFPGQALTQFQKMASAAISTVMAYDADNLYVGWEVKDDTPWVNGADAPEFLYARGDTVDLQLATNAEAKPDRADGVLGDLRLSIGAYKGKPTAVIYRKVAATKSPKSFSSGVVKDYVMESVVVASDIKVEVKVDSVKRRYIVEAAISFKTLEFTPKAGQTIRGDIGATHGNKAGDDTALRTHWSNQQTGLVSDEVFELQMTPKNWSEMKFE